MLSCNWSANHRGATKLSYFFAMSWQDDGNLKVATAVYAKVECRTLPRQQRPARRNRLRVFAFLSEIQRWISGSAPDVNARTIPTQAQRYIGPIVIGLESCRGRHEQQ